MSALPLLVSFMPMLMDTAGNCGNQISTLMVRGLALGEVEPADFVRVLGKELRVSAIVGAVLGIVNGLRIYLMYTFLFPGQYANVMGYAIVVSVSLFFSVILAKLVGGMLPLAAKKLGADPAIMATPLHHHHRGRLQPDPVFPDRTAGIPQYDVNNRAMPDSLEVTARHFYRTNPLSQNLTVLPAPSKREPLACRKLCTLAGNFSVLPKAPSQRGLSSAARLGKFAPGAPTSSSFFRCGKLQFSPPFPHGKTAAARC